MSDRQNRDRHEESQDDLDVMFQEPGGGSDALLVQTGSGGGYPTSALVYYPVYPVVISGVETEGTSGTLGTDIATSMTALNVGTKVVPANTYVIAHIVGGRLVFRYDG